MSDLEDATLPPSWDALAEPGSRDLRLVAEAPQIDAGVDLPNSNDSFALVARPDMGAFEAGQPLPHYGPRPWVRSLVFADGCESGDTSAWNAGHQ